MGKFGDALNQQVGGAVGGLIGTGMGLLLEGHNDRRQLKQQGKLMEQQWKFDQRAMDYNYEKQLQMWKDTNYGAQMEQLKLAGLNPGLIYGMGGAGGAVTGGGSQGVHSAQAPSGGPEIMGLMQQRASVALLEAQRENIEADTNLKNVDANKRAGVDTQEAQTRIADLTQGIKNKEAVEELTKVQTEIARTDLGFNKASYDDRLEYINEQAREMTGRATQALVQGNLDTYARETRLNTIKAEYVGRLLENGILTLQQGAIRQSITESKERVRLMGNQSRQIIEDLMKDWESLGVDMREQRVKEILSSYNTDPTTDIIRGIAGSIGSILIIGTTGGKGDHKEVKGFRR